MTATTTDTAAPQETQTQEMRVIDIIDEIEEGADVYFKYTRLAKDLMTRQLHSTNLDGKIRDVWTIMSTQNTRHVAVIDTEDGTEAFVGIISRRDLARQLSRGVGTTGESDADQSQLNASASGVMTRKPRSVSLSEDLFGVVNIMLEDKIDCVPVTTDEGKLVGFLTANDFILTFPRISKLQKMANTTERRKARLIDLRGGKKQLDSKTIVNTHFQSVGDVMTEKPLCLPPNAPLTDAMKLMQDNRFRHVPIVDAAQKCVGLLSDTDVLHTLPPSAEKSPSKGGGQAPKFREALFACDPADQALRTEVRLAMSGAGKFVTARRTDELLPAIQSMLQAHASALVVLGTEQEGDAIVGILTETDLLRSVCVVGQMLGLC